MAKVIMVQGTMSNVGKSLIVAGLCRGFKEDGYRVAPFKSQNMALNSFVTKDGKEMGRAQVMQAEAAGIEPNVSMNPILLKPTGNMTSQVIVNGKAIGDMGAREYFAYKSKLMPVVLDALKSLSKDNDIIVIEGAGSPAEINLKENDIVNMGLAKAVNAPVLLVGDIDRGGVFAQLLGTLELLEAGERELVAGLVINKFRGDKSLLDPGLTMIENRSKKPILGCIPYFENNLEGEDSLSVSDSTEEAEIDICIIKLPRISNFTDFDNLRQIPGVGIRFITRVSEASGADMIIIPGSKNTIGDLLWLKERGFDKYISKIQKTTPVFGICGGFQMLGKSITDTIGAEGGGRIEGLSLLDINTEFYEEKVQNQVSGVINAVDGPFSTLSGEEYVGYEIHMGLSERVPKDSCIVNRGNVYGTYVHGIFDKGRIAGIIVNELRRSKGLPLLKTEPKDFVKIKEAEFEKLGRVIRENLDIKSIYGLLREAVIRL